MQKTRQSWLPVQFIISLLRAQQCFLDLFHSFDDDVFVSSESPVHGSLIRLQEKNAQTPVKAKLSVGRFRNGPLKEIC